MEKRYKNLVKDLLVKSGILRLADQVNSPKIAILRYHSIQHHPETFSHSIGVGIIHSKLIFEEEMELLARKFNPVTVDEILLFLKGGMRVPKRPVAITFDDGFTDNFEVAKPILDRFGIRATFYVTVNSIESKTPPWFCRLRNAFWTTKREEYLDSEKGRLWKFENWEKRNDAFLFACERCARLAGDSQTEAVRLIENTLDVEPVAAKQGIMMTWDQMRKLHQAGHTIGSHTLTHPNLAHIGNEDLHRELVESKRVLEDKIGTSIIHFSYPSPILQPHWTERTIEVTKQAGYETAVTCTSGSVSASTNPLSLSRIWVPADRNEFLWNLECTLLGRKM